jgi:hypothetical protein
MVRRDRAWSHASHAPGDRCSDNLVPAEALAHAVAAGDKSYIQSIAGAHLFPFAYLGAKHMVTGYGHLLFLLGVIFFLYRSKDIGIYVTLFAVGHSTTCSSVC